MTLERVTNNYYFIIQGEDMREYLDKDEVLCTSKLDYRGQLKTAGLFDLFMDLAA